MDSASRRGLILISFWALASTIVGRSFTALSPGQYDAYLFGYVGFEWLHGSLPYVEIWDIKPPGIYSLVALVFSLFPKSFLALAIVEGIFVLGCIGTVYLLIRQCGAPRLAALFATATASVAGNLVAFNEGGNLTEIYLLWPATLSMYFFSKAGPRFQGKWIVLAGFFSGVASLFKPVGLSPLLAQGTFLVLLALALRRLSFRDSVASLLTNGAGVLLAWVPYAVYFSLHNALGEMVNAIFIVPAKLGGMRQGGVLFAAKSLISNLQPLASLAVGAALGLMLYGMVSLSSKRRAELEAKNNLGLYFFWPLVLIWVFFDLCGALAGGPGYPHYFLPLTPSLCVAAGFTYTFLIERIPEGARFRAVRSVIFALILGPLLFPQASDVGKMLNLTVLGQQPPVPPWKMVASYLNSIRGPSDTLLIWNYLPGIYLTTEMKSASRQLFVLHFLDYPEAYEGFGEEILRNVKRAPPRFIVAPREEADFRTIRESIYREKFVEMLKNQYLVIYTADKLNVYEYRGSSHALSK